MIVELDGLAQPPGGLCLWRYMDLSKFVLLLDASALWFSHVPLLGDPHEGSRGPATIAARTAYVRSELEAARIELLQKGHDPSEVIDVDAAMPDLVAQDSRMAQTMRMMMYVNCWHANEDESVAMWRLYGGTPGGSAQGLVDT